MQAKTMAKHTRKHAQKTPTLGLAMIVKNGGDTLRNCLKSVQGIVDSIVIGDTGSTDDTLEIALEFGARVVHLHWNNDFASARNAVLAHMDTDWILSLDADEAVAEGSAKWIKEAIADRKIAAYHVQLRNYLSPRIKGPLDQVMLRPDEVPAYLPDTLAYAPSAAMRLFRRDPKVFFIGCIHEMIEHRILALGRAYRDGGFIIHHFGWYLDSPERKAEKRRDYFDLLGNKLRELPNDTNSLIRYGWMLCEDGNTDEGLDHFTRATRIAPQTPFAWLWKGTILAGLHRYEEALEALERVPANESQAMRMQLTGNCLLALGRVESSLAAYQDALKHAPGDRLIAAKLGLVEIHSGRQRDGLHRIRTAAETTPGNEDVDQVLVRAYLAANQIPEALAAGEAFARRYKRADAWLEVATTHAQHGDWTKAFQTINAAIEQLPDAVTLHEFRTTAAIAQSAWPEAVTAATRVVELAPARDKVLRLAAVLHHVGLNAQAKQLMDQWEPAR